MIVFYWIDLTLWTVSQVDNCIVGAKQCGVLSVPIQVVNANDSYQMKVPFLSFALESWKTPLMQTGRGLVRKIAVLFSSFLDILLPFLVTSSQRLSVWPLSLSFLRLSVEGVSLLFTVLQPTDETRGGVESALGSHVKELLYPQNPFSKNQQKYYQTSLHTVLVSLCW